MSVPHSASQHFASEDLSAKEDASTQAESSAVTLAKKPTYRLVPSTTPLPSQMAKKSAGGKPEQGDHSANPNNPAKASGSSAFLRAENEDDDGYDPYSDRPAPTEPLFQENPWD